MLPIGSAHIVYQLRWNAFGCWLILFLSCFVQPAKPSAGHPPHLLPWGPLYFHFYQKRTWWEGQPWVPSWKFSLGERKGNMHNFLDSPRCHALFHCQALHRGLKKKKYWLGKEWVNICFLESMIFQLSVFWGLELWSSANLYLRA